MPVKAVVFVSADPKKTRQALERLPQPWYLVTGRFDGVTVVQNETLKALGEQVVTQVRAVDGVTRTETYPVLREVTKAGRDNGAVRAFVLVRTEPKKTEQVFGSLAGLAESTWTASVSGRYDVVVQLGAPTWDDLTNVLFSKVRALDGVVGTDTVFVAN